MFTYPRLFAVLAILLIPVFLCFAAPASSQATRSEAQERFDKGVKLQNAGKLDEAIKEYQAVKKLEPRAVPPLINLGIIYVRKNQLGNAESAFTQVLAIEPRNEYALEQLARVLMARDKNTQAVKYARMLLGQKPKDFDARFLFGVANLRANDLPAATEAFRSAVHARPNDTSALYNLGYCYVLAEKFGDAVQTLEKVLKIDAGHSQARMMTAYAAEEMQDPTTAIKHYEAAAKDPETAISALLNIARIYASRGDDEKSFDALKRAAAKDPTNYEAQLNLGRHYYARDELQQAETSLRAAKKSRPNDSAANAYLALTLTRLQKHDEAIASAETAVKSEPKNKMAIEILGFALESSQQMDRAVEVYKQWASYYPDDGLPNLKIANIYFFQRKNDLAYAEFDTAMRKSPKDIEIIRAYAEAAAANQDYEKSSKLYEQAMSLKPGDPDMLVSAAVVLQRQSKFDDAAALLTKATAIDSGNIGARLALAQVYQNQNKPDAAIEQYRKAVELDENNIAALHSLAGLYGTQEDYQAQIEVYRKLADISPDNSAFALEILRIYEEKLNDVNTATLEARKLVQSSPAENSYRSALARLLVKSENFEEALEQYEAIAAGEEIASRTYAYTEMGEIYEKLEKTNEAMEYYKKAIELRPDYNKALDAIGRLYENESRSDQFYAYLESLVEKGEPDRPYRYFFDALKKADKAEDAVKVLEGAAAVGTASAQISPVLAYAYSELGQKEQAIEQYKRVLAENEDDPWANRELGAIYKSMDRLQEAADCYAKASEVFSYDRALLLELAELYEKMGQPGLAIDTYRRYLQADPANHEIKKKVQQLETPDSTDVLSTDLPSETPSVTEETSQ